MTCAGQPVFKNVRFFQHKAWGKLKHVECVCQNAIAGILDDGSALHWSEVTASSLLGIGVDNEIVENGSLGGQPEESAACIHLGLREHSYLTSHQKPF